MPSPNTVCDSCGRDFYKKPSLKERSNNDFCSNECRGEWQSENVSGKDHHQYNRINVECNNCGKEKEVQPSHDEKVENHYCDSECMAEDFDYAGEDNPSWSNSSITVSCYNCGDEYSIYENKYKQQNRFFCSIQCQADWRKENWSGKNCPMWQGYSDYYGDNWTMIREKVRNRDNRSCQMCGDGVDELSVNPDTHHITPISEFDDVNESNTMDNLVLLCSTCHGISDEYIPEDLQRKIFDLG